MWDLLFGKPKKRYYKPKKKLVNKQEKVAKKRIIVSKQSNQKIDFQSRETVAETMGTFKNNIAEKITNTTVSAANADISNTIIESKMQQKTVVNIEIYDKLVNRLKQEISTIFLSAFLAKTDNGLVIKSWFMDDSQSQILSKIYVNTDLFLFGQSHAKIKSYYILDLDEHKILFALKLDSNQFTMVLNSNETSVGYLISIVKPIIEEHIKNN